MINFIKCHLTPKSYVQPIKHIDHNHATAESKTHNLYPPSSSLTHLSSLPSCVSPFSQSPRLYRRRRRPQPRRIQRRRRPHRQRHIPIRRIRHRRPRRLRHRPYDDRRLRRPLRQRQVLRQVNRVRRAERQRCTGFRRVRGGCSARGGDAGEDRGGGFAFGEGAGAVYEAGGCWGGG